jgi:filamentous hemagglutinin family protein
MNKTYTLVWNTTQGIWQVAGERARRRGKSRARAVLAAALLAGGASSALALPAGEKVISGKADVLRYDDGKQMSINQPTDKLIMEWNGFGIERGERVTFNQLSPNSIALNRVVGTDASRIYGNLDANGRVFLVNPNGVLFGNTARVNVGGLVATTLDIKNEDFDAGRFRFSGESQARVSNEGVLTASERGAIALLGAKVINQGVVQAQMGTVALGAGKTVTLNFDGGKLLSLQIDEGVANALAHNLQLLKADGGTVLMSAKTASDMAGTVVNNQGSIEARTLRNTAGRITLDGGERGVVNVAGALNASATTPGNAGTIVTRGGDVQVALGTMVDTRATNGRGGVWQIASSDTTVKTGANQSGTIAADTLSRNLATTDVELVAERGKLSVEGPVSWASGTRLAFVSRDGDIAVKGALRATGTEAAVTFDAKRDVRIAAPVALTGANGRVTLNYGGAFRLDDGAAVTLSGANPGFESNGFRYIVIQTLAQLQAVNGNLGGLFVLGNNIAGNNARFNTIGSGTAFSGTFDGLGNSISRLMISSADPYAGLFGLNTGQISNLALQSLNVSGAAGIGQVMIGGLVGENQGRISNVTATGMTVSGGASRNNSVGGLVGINRGDVERASFAGTVTGNNLSYAVGGLVGENDAYQQRGSITDSSTNATVSGGTSNLASIGGLVGVNRGGSIVNASALGATTGANLSGVNIGGLVGANLIGGTIADSMASGRVTGGTGGTVGGLVGLNSGTIEQSEARGVVDGRYAQAIGGFAGINQGEILGGKALGAVTSASTGAIGGFVGINQGNAALIDMAEAYGAVSGGQGNVGGFVGSHLGGVISHAVARGKTVGGANSKTGGFVGYNAATLTDVDASGEVFGGSSASVGGFAGHNAISGLISVSAATGNVTGGAYGTVGGFVGENLGTVRDVSASGSVGGGCVATLGGLVGMNLGLIERSVASGRINGSSSSSMRQTFGGLVGVNRGTIRHSGTAGEAAQQQFAGLNLGLIE